MIVLEAIHALDKRSGKTFGGLYIDVFKCGEPRVPQCILTTFQFILLKTD